MSGNTKDFKVKSGIQPTVYHEAVGTVVSGSVGYSISSASYDSISFSTNAQITTGSNYDVAFSSDGTAMYVNAFSMSTVFQYTLSTAWDISTASYASKSLNHSSTVVSVFAMDFSTNGTELYLLGQDVDTIYQFDLSTAWDISTASYVSKSYAVSQDNSNEALKFSSDGTKLYTGGSATDTIYQHSLSTAWDLSTATYDSVNFSAASQDTRVRSVDFNSTGSKMFICGADTDTVYQYSLSTAWDLSTSTYDSVNFSVASQETNPYGFCFGNDGIKMYLSGSTADVIYQYSTVLTTASLDLSSGSVFDYTPTSDVQVTLTNPAASGTSSGATLLLTGTSNTFDIANGSYDSVSFSTSSQTGSLRDVAFKSDGTKMYVVSSSNNYAYQYSLSTAWDVSTASYDSVFINVSSRETILSSLTFSSDGTKVYFAGPDTDNVHQYNLSTPWDLNTDSYAQSFSASGTVNLYCVRFSSDGTKMYLGQYSATNIYQYSLSTAWDISTASYDSVSLALRSGTTAYGFDFNDDGTEIYVCSGSIGSVYRMDLSTAWDISTGTDSNVTFSVTSQDTNPTYVRFKPDGSKMYVSGDTNTNIYQYSTESGITVTYDPDLQWPGGTAPTAPAAGETDVLTFNTTDGGTSYKAVVAIDGAS